MVVPMSERDHSPETNFSPEQARLIASAREILAFPSTQSNEFVERRPTTPREKAAVVLGKLTGRDRRPIFPPDNPFTDRLSEAPKSVCVTRTKRVDKDRWARAEGSWYVGEKTTTDVDTGVKTEQLSIYRTTMQPLEWGGPNGYDERPRLEENHELLEPMDNPDEVARLQTLLDEGLDWERHQSQ
jgi:hypothetical protein